MTVIRSQATFSNKKLAFPEHVLCTSPWAKAQNNGVGPMIPILQMRK